MNSTTMGVSNSGGSPMSAKEESGVQDVPTLLEEAGRTIERLHQELEVVSAELRGYRHAHEMATFGRGAGVDGKSYGIPQHLIAADELRLRAATIRRTLGR